MCFIVLYGLYEWMLINYRDALNGEERSIGFIMLLGTIIIIMILLLITFLITITAFILILIQINK